MFLEGKYFIFISFILLVIVVVCNVVCLCWVFCVVGFVLVVSNIWISFLFFVVVYMLSKLIYI